MLPRSDRECDGPVDDLGKPFVIPVSGAAGGGLFRPLATRSRIHSYA